MGLRGARLTAGAEAKVCLTGSRGYLQFGIREDGET